MRGIEELSLDIFARNQTNAKRQTLKAGQNPARDPLSATQQHHE
jgi:hypothetical protein